jgi:small-conductance mechanosensitive channel
VAYDSDVEKALALLVAIAEREPRIVRGAKAPKAFITGFADSGVNLELGVWINDPHVGHLDLRSSISRAILKEFAAHGIDIPYPRRDVRIVGGESPAQHALESRDAAERTPAR